MLEDDIAPTLPLATPGSEQPQPDVLARPAAGSDRERQARMALSCVCDAGDPRLTRELARIGPIALLRGLIAGNHGPALAERARRLDLVDYQAAVTAGRFRFIIPGDPEWPPGLADLAEVDAVHRRGGVPYGLWLRGPGRLDQLVTQSVAVVGSRASSGYGDAVASELSHHLAASGWTVVSGGAYGIDAAAHRGALSADGPTIAVLANGVDVGYPQGNAALFDSIADQHLIVSELPPGTHPTRVRFLARNRMIAAMTTGTIVVEAALRSGARNTASWADLLSRQLLAVPGSIYSALSATPHLLVREQRATLIGSAAEALELLADTGDQLISHRSAQTRPTDELTGVQLAVFEALTRSRYRTAGEVALAAGLTMPQCLAELSALADAGLAESGPGGWRVSQ